MKIILATSSKLRIQAFDELDLDFVSEESNVDEYFAGRPNDPVKLVEYLSQLKAESVAKKHRKGVVIGFDSVGYFKGKILEKPKNKKNVFDRIKKLSGDSHQFFTGIYMTNLENKKTLSDVVKTDIVMRKLNSSEIRNYITKNNDYLSCSLGYNPLNGYSASFINTISGSYNNIISGIPLERVVEMLDFVGYEFKR